MNELLISIRNYNSDNYKDIINNIKKVGFKNVFVEWYNQDLKLQKDILNYVQELGLNIVFAHLGYQNANALWEDNEFGDMIMNQYIEDIKDCKKSGIDLVVMHPTFEDGNPGMNEIGLRRIKKILDVAADYDMKVAFENVELVEYLEYIVKNVHRSNLFFCFDVGHCHLFNNDDFDIELFKNKIFIIHLHDNFKKLDDHNLPFDGTVDWEKSIKQIIDMHYDGYMAIESGYNNYYKNLSLEEYYKLAYERGMKIRELFELYKK